MRFSKELSVGNRILDSEHEKLHDMINGIARAVATGEVAALSEFFELLENGLCAYFVVEENIAHTQQQKFRLNMVAFLAACLPQTVRNNRI